MEIACSTRGHFVDAARSLFAPSLHEENRSTVISYRTRCLDCEHYNFFYFILTVSKLSPTMTTTDSNASKAILKMREDSSPKSFAKNQPPVPVSSSTASFATNRKEEDVLLLGTPLKRMIDETQLSPDDREQLEKRRKYNRECATRARKKTKQLVSQLQGQVEGLTKDKEKLLRSKKAMQAKMQLLEKHNQALLVRQLVSEQRQAASLSTAALHPGGMAGYSSLSAAGLSSGMMFPGLGFHGL